jgi:cytoskeleton protein RodZ
MSNPTIGAKPEGEVPETKIGEILYKARLAAHIEVNKICADLRISPQALEAIEQGNYHLLPGDPYVRALLGSMSRYLAVDSQAIIKGYNKEIGATQAVPSVAPYNQDDAQTHKTAHKQIFVAIVIALFVVLILIIGKLNKGSENAPVTPSPVPAADSLSAPRQDTALESKSLAPDSAATKAPADTGRDSLKTRRAAAPGVAASIAAPGNPSDTAGLNSAVIKPLFDSVGVRVVRSGKEDVAMLLRLGKQMQVSHTDTIIVFTSKKKSVEVMTGESTVTPDRKRFKIYGHTVKTF